MHYPHLLQDQNIDDLLKYKDHAWFQRKIDQKSTSISPGARMMLTGLQSEEGKKLNGQLVTVHALDVSSERWLVDMINGGKRTSVNPANLVFPPNLFASKK